MSVDVIFGEIIREYFESVAKEMNTTMDNTVRLADLQRDARLLGRALLLRRQRGQPDRPGQRRAGPHLRLGALGRGPHQLLPQRSRRRRHRDGQRPLLPRQPHPGLDHRQAGLLQEQAGLLPRHPRAHGGGRRPAGGRLQLRARATSGRRASGWRRSSSSSAASCAATTSTCCGPTTARRRSWRATSTRCSAPAASPSAG